MTEEEKKEISYKLLQEQGDLGNEIPLLEAHIKEIIVNFGKATEIGNSVLEKEYERWYEDGLSFPDSSTFSQKFMELKEKRQRLSEIDSILNIKR